MVRARRQTTRRGLSGVALAAVFGLLMAAPIDRSLARPQAGTISPEKVIRYLREKFGISSSSPVTAEGPRKSAHPGLYELTINVGEGKDRRTTTVNVSQDGRLLVLGQFFDLGADLKTDVARHVHDFFKLPDTVQISSGPLAESGYGPFLSTAVTVLDGAKKQTQKMYVTRDRRTLLIGSIFNMEISPQLEALRGIRTEDQPSVGPASARVTMVEYADLQCPTCARLHDLMENEILPKYGSKVRVVFKDFPLVQVHDWALMGAVAGQCVYRINPEAYFPFRSLVFHHQSGISAANAREALVQYGQEAGIDRIQLGACIDSKETLPRVEAGIREGQALGISSTPTCFVNGKIVVGAAPEEYTKVLDEALAARGARASGSRGGAREARHTPQARQESEQQQEVKQADNPANH